MEIKTCPIYPYPGLTVAEIHHGCDRAWHFLPFEDRQANLYPLNDRYILALGDSKGVAVFDRIERKRVLLLPNFEYVGTSRCTKSWCFSENYNCLFFQEWEERPSLERSGKIGLRQISVDGAIDQKIALDIDFHVAELLVRGDGTIVCVERTKVVIFDPELEDTNVWYFHEHERLIDYDNDGYRYSDDEFRWYSDDVRYGLRLKLKPEVTFHPSWAYTSKLGQAMNSLFQKARLGSQSEKLHPDLPGDGTPQIGLAIEIFQLAPFKLIQTIVVRYFPEASFKSKFIWRHNGAFLTPGEEEEYRKRVKYDPAVSVHYPLDLHMRLKAIQWPANSNELKVTLVEGTRLVPSIGPEKLEGVQDVSFRTISLDGEIGPLEFVSGEARLPDSDKSTSEFDSLPSDKAMNAIRKLIRERTSHHIECGQLNGDSLAHALKRVRQLIENQGLEKLVFNNQLRFKFRVEGKLLGEKRIFKAIQQMPPETTKVILPELRELLLVYGIEAREITKNGSLPIMSSVSEQGSAGLSEAAITLAKLDSEGFDALRDWIISIDQEHDYFAAEKVFPEFANNTGFETPKAIRFGIWFFLQQWQTVRYGENWLGLFVQARRVMTPSQFAIVVTEEWEGVADFLSEKWAGPVFERVKDVLGADDWSRDALMELDNMLDDRAM